MIVAEISVVPIGTCSTSLSKYVKKAIEELKKRVRVYPNAMGTVVEAESLEEIFEAVKAAHESLFDMGVKRVVTTIRIDDRRDLKSSVERKMKAILANDEETQD